MSYCRFLEGDVYVFMSTGGWLECCWCHLQDEGPLTFKSTNTQDMVSHLREHQSHGDQVPERVFDDLWLDDMINFPPLR
jgi:hypothetical protein